MQSKSAIYEQIILKFENNIKNYLLEYVSFKCLLTIQKKINTNTWRHYKLCDDKIYCLIDCRDMIFDALPESNEYIYAIKPLYIVDEHAETTYNEGIINSETKFIKN